MSEKQPIIELKDIPNLEIEMNAINPLFKQNKGWLSPEKVGVNDTNEFKKLMRRIYKRVFARLNKN